MKKLLEEMKECKEATIADDIQEKYSKNVREAIERIENRIETERFKKSLKSLNALRISAAVMTLNCLKPTAKKRGS